METFDFEKMEEFCKMRFEKTHFINIGMKIENDLLRKLQKLVKETSLQIVTDCIEGSNDFQTNRTSYNVEVNCKTCGKKMYKQLSKTKLKDVLANNLDFDCPECFENYLNKQSIKGKEYREQLKQRKQQYTKIVIENYINPACSWKEEIPKEDYYSRLGNFMYYADEAEIAEKIKELDYRDFLQTPYWKAIAYEKKKKANFRCELCNKKGLLNVHHKTYERHGYEFYNLKDLIVLCDDCHKKFHEIGE